MRHRPLVITACALLALLASAAAFGQNYDAPANYYASATGAGPTLKSQLQAIVSNMTGVNYGDARYSAPITDPDPAHPGNILLIYDRASVSGVWDENGALPWNREHIWPVSRLGVTGPSNTTINISTDQFNLRPADTDINANRANTPFGSDSDSGNHGYRGAYYYPGDADAGDVARSQFYMATRYSSQLTLTDNTPPTGTQMGDLSSLVNYHFRDVPDAFERRRNHAIYGLAGLNSPAIANPYAQQNRNPYVDRPEYVWSVFVDQANDSQISVSGAQVDAAGGSTRLLDLGRLIVGAAVPAPQPVTLNKAGVDGTYFQVTASGGATSSITGRYNAFRNALPDAKTIQVGLAASTASAGRQDGAVTIDNLDITAGGGAGHGAGDANDVIDVTLSVLDHATPSFAAGQQITTLMHDFGVIAVGAPAPVFSFDLFNRAGLADFTARLDLDSIVGQGDVAALATNIVPFTGIAALPAGAASAFVATLDASAAGAFSASYALSFSDEDLPGVASRGSLVLNLSGIVAPAPDVSADFDEDGDVDGHDFLAWQRHFGAEPASREDGDADGDQAVDTADVEAWADQFGQTASSPAHAVPEPAAILVVSLAACAAPLIRRGYRVR